jgi:preprotein translocase subunit SecE
LQTGQAEREEAMKTTLIVISAALLLAVVLGG